MSKALLIPLVVSERVAMDIHCLEEYSTCAACLCHKVEAILLGGEIRC